MPESGAMAGTLPPAASRAGRRYYAFLPRHGGPAVVAGAELAVRELGGHWGARGRAPRGFSELEHALNYLALECPGWAVDSPEAATRLACEGTHAFPVRFR